MCIRDSSTLRRPLQSVDFTTREPVKAAYERSDVCVVPAAGVAAEAMVALTDVYKRQLIDWESGILPVLRTVLANHGQSLPDAAILELYGEFEAEAESGPYQCYRDVLQSVVRAFADRFHFQASSAEIRSLHESLLSLIHI